MEPQRRLSTCCKEVRTMQLVYVVLAANCLCDGTVLARPAASLPCSTSTHRVQHGAADLSKTAPRSTCYSISCTTPTTIPRIITDFATRFFSYALFINLPETFNCTNSISDESLKTIFLTSSQNE